MISTMPAAASSTAEAERPADARGDGRARGADVEGQLAAEQRRRDAAQHEMRVGDGGLGPAAPVADGAGLRARAARAHA